MERDGKERAKGKCNANHQYFMVRNVAKTLRNEEKVVASTEQLEKTKEQDRLFYKRQFIDIQA